MFYKTFTNNLVKYLKHVHLCVLGRGEKCMFFQALAAFSNFALHRELLRSCVLRSGCCCRVCALSVIPLMGAVHVQLDDKCFGNCFLSLSSGVCAL